MVTNHRNLVLDGQALGLRTPTAAIVGAANANRAVRGENRSVS